MLCTVSLLIVSTIIAIFKGTNCKSLSILDYDYRLDHAACLFHVECDYFNEFASSEKSQCSGQSEKIRTYICPYPSFKELLYTYHQTKIDLDELKSQIKLVIYSVIINTHFCIRCNN